MGYHQRMVPTRLKADIPSRERGGGIPTKILNGKVNSAEAKDLLESTSPKVYLELSGLAILNEDKRGGWLNNNESRTYSLIKDRLKHSYFSVLAERKWV